MKQKGNRAKIIMVFVEGEYVFGIYDFETESQKKYVNELAQKVGKERQCHTYVKVVE